MTFERSKPRKRVIQLLVWFCLLAGVFTMAWSAESPAAAACHELAQHALTENNKDCAMRCLELGLLLTPDDRDCKLLKAKIEKNIEVQTVQSPDTAACCETIRTQAMSHPNLLIRSLGLQVIREFRPKDRKVATALALCLNEGSPNNFDSTVKEFKEGRQISPPKRKPFEAKLAEQLASKALSIMGEVKNRKQAEQLTLAALGLDADCELALRAQAGLTWGFDDGSNPPASLDDKALIDQLLKKATSNKKTPAKQKLLIRAAEAVNHADDDVILQLTDLEALGEVESLSDLVKSVAGIRPNIEVSAKKPSKPSDTDSPKKKESDSPPKEIKGKVIELVSPLSDDAKELVEHSSTMSLTKSGILIDASEVAATSSNYLLSIESRHYELSATFKIDALGPDGPPNYPGFGLMFGDSTRSNKSGNGTLYIARLACADGKKLLILDQSMDNSLNCLDKVEFDNNYDFQKTHELTIEVKGKNIYVKVDGETMITHEVDAMSEGRFGYFYDHCKVQVLNTTIKFRGNEK